MEYLTIGQMAERNCITKKTLRLYHEKGLLSPAFIDDSNGRRYYTSAQCYTLDLIQRLQSIGLPLADIAVLIAENDDAALEEAILQQMDRLDQQRKTLSTAYETAKELSSGIFLRKATVSLAEALPQPVLAHFDAVPILNFTCEELGIEPLDMTWHDCSHMWYQVMAKVKKSVEKLLAARDVDLPVPLVFKKVGLKYQHEDYLADNYTSREIFVVLNEDTTSVLGDGQVIPEGNYLTISGECLSLVGVCGGHCVPTTSARKTFQCAKEHGLNFASTCYIETLVDPLALRDGAVESLFRARLPIT